MSGGCWAETQISQVHIEIEAQIPKIPRFQEKCNWVGNYPILPK